jgi:hypothetical protein
LESTDNYILSQTETRYIARKDYASETGGEMMPDNVGIPKQIWVSGDPYTIYSDGREVLVMSDRVDKESCMASEWRRKV